MLGMANKKKPAPVRTGKAINVWIDAKLHDALSRFLASHRPPPTTTSVVEVALEDFLRARGFLDEDDKDD